MQCFSRLKPVDPWLNFARDRRRNKIWAEQDLNLLTGACFKNGFAVPFAIPQGLKLPGLRHLRHG
jgi:hypothetical protein